MVYTDHLGNQFKSVRKMCEYWGVSESAVRHRCKLGYNAEQCLTGKGIIGTRTPCMDHLENCFESIAEMCDYWGVDRSTFNDRVKAGHTLEQCLTGKGLRGNGSRTKPCTDHLGNQFKSVSDMVKHYGISDAVFYYRFKAGWTLEQCLTGKDDSGKPCTDHLGNQFKSVSDMMKHYGVSKSAFYNRCSNGYTLEQCLTGNGIRKYTTTRGSCTDHLGNQFKSIEQMAAHYGISISALQYRLKAGYTLEQSLTLKSKNKHK
ncbi:MAG: hypothetical protein U0L26_05700 [Cellulosilyticum sp.]|nr:hypothetical protein [Cellulosilyticum sp.]